MPIGKKATSPKPAAKRTQKPSAKKPSAKRQKPVKKTLGKKKSRKLVKKDSPEVAAYKKSIAASKKRVKALKALQLKRQNDKWKSKSRPGYNEDKSFA